MPELAGQSSTRAAASRVQFERALERLTDERIENLRTLPLDEWRRRVEGSKMRPVKVVRLWPILGRGNVLGDRLVGHDAIEKALDEALHNESTNG